MNFAHFTDGQHANTKHVVIGDTYCADTMQTIVFNIVGRGGLNLPFARKMRTASELAEVAFLHQKHEHDVHSEAEQFLDAISQIDVESAQEIQRISRGKSRQKLGPNKWTKEPVK